MAREAQPGVLYTFRTGPYAGGDFCISVRVNDDCLVLLVRDRFAAVKGPHVPMSFAAINLDLYGVQAPAPKSNWS